MNTPESDIEMLFMASFIWLNTAPIIKIRPKTLTKHYFLIMSKVCNPGIPKILRDTQETL